jgi:hypothetical protein
MALVPDNVINAYKSVVDIASLPAEASRYALANIGLQNKCLFEVIIYPEKFPTSIKGIAFAAMDLLVMRLYLYSINDIPLVGFDYQRSGGMQNIKDAIYPENFTCTFLENQAGSVKRYLREWQDLIAEYDPTTREYFFNDNQKESERTCIIIPQQTDVLPSPEWIKIDGMKIKNIAGIGYDHASGEQEIITVDFKCDNIRLSLGTSAF